MPRHLTIVDCVPNPQQSAVPVPVLPPETGLILFGDIVNDTYVFEWLYGVYTLRKLDVETGSERLLTFGTIDGDELPFGRIGDMLGKQAYTNVQAAYTAKYLRS